MKTWWQVYYYDLVKDCVKVFGFSTIGNFVSDHPEYTWKGVHIEDYKHEIRSLPYYQVIKICEQVIR